MPSERPAPPTVRLRRLASDLRRLRDATGLTREQVAEQTGINTATLYRHETARSRPQRRTMIALLDLYGANEQQRADLLALSKEAAAQGWLRPYHAELPEQYTGYISFEAEARTVRDYESLFIPGLLQTEEYAQAALKAGLPMATHEEVDRRVQARLDRQSLLSREDPLRLWAIVDEAALHRLVGGPDAMRRQLQKLVTATTDPHITVQVIAYAAGAHAGMQGAFVLLDYADPADPEIVSIESMAGDLFLEAEADVRRYNVLFDNLRAMALSPDESIGLIAGLAADAP